MDEAEEEEEEYWEDLEEEFEEEEDLEEEYCLEEEEEFPPSKGKVACPICNISFSQGDVEDHAATCEAGGQ